MILLWDVIEVVANFTILREGTVTGGGLFTDISLSPDNEIRIIHDVALASESIIFSNSTADLAIVAFDATVDRILTGNSTVNFSISNQGKTVTSDQLPVTSYQLPVTSDQLPVTSYQLSVTSYQLPVTSYQNYDVLSWYKVNCHGTRSTVMVQLSWYKVTAIAKLCVSFAKQPPLASRVSVPPLASC